MAPLAVGVLWIALFAVGEWVGDVLSPSREINLGFVPAGLAWMVLGYVVGFGGRDEPSAHSTTRSPSSAQPPWATMIRALDCLRGTVQTLVTSRVHLRLWMYGELCVP